MRRLVSWINHLPPVCWSTFWKLIFKHQLGCRFYILYSVFSFFCILTYAIIYVLIHHIIFWLYLYFLNILHFFKYSCTDIFHRRSLVLSIPNVLLINVTMKIMSRVLMLYLRATRYYYESTSMITKFIIDKCLTFYIEQVLLCAFDVP